MPNTERVGIRVECALCHRTKKPVGRDTPLGTSMCEAMECPGYDTEPRVGSLWPGESESDFGFPVSDRGTRRRVKVAVPEDE